jgi:hypothetical protein
MSPTWKAISGVTINLCCISLRRGASVNEFYYYKPVSYSIFSRFLPPCEWEEGKTYDPTVSILAERSDIQQLGGINGH